MKIVKIGNERNDVIYVGSDREVKELFLNLWNNKYKHISLGNQNYPPKEDTGTLCGIYVSEDNGLLFNYISAEDILFEIMSNSDTMEINDFDEKSLVENWISFEHGKDYEWFKKR